MSNPVSSKPAENRQATPAVAAARFFVSATAEPGVAPRVLELFAKRGLLPDDFHARATASRQNIEIRAKNMAPADAAYIGRCLRQIVHVERVLVSREESIADGA